MFTSEQVDIDEVPSHDLSSVTSHLRFTNT